MPINASWKHKNESNDTWRNSESIGKVDEADLEITQPINYDNV